VTLSRRHQRLTEIFDETELGIMQGVLFRESRSRETTQFWFDTGRNSCIYIYL
jgi:hypothetical protein